MPAERSGVHLTGGDSGWPVAADPEPDPHKDGTGTDDGNYPKAEGYYNGTILTEDAANEVQTLSITAEGGTFTLASAEDETDALPFDVAASALKTALEGLSDIGSGNVNVTGGPGATADLVITFGGDLDYEDIPELVVDDANLTGEGAEATITETIAGSE